MYIYFTGQPNQRQLEFLKIKKNVQLKGHNQENAKIPDVTVNTCNPSTWEMEMKAGGFIQ